MRKQIILFTAFAIGSLASYAELTHRYTFERGVSDQLGQVDGVAATATTNTEAPLFSADIPAGAVSHAPTQSIELGMNQGTKKSGFILDASVISLDQGSYSLWIKADSMAQGHYIFSALGGSSGPKLLGRNGSEVRVVVGQGSASVNLPISLNTWHHIVVSWDNPGGELSVYFDGSLAGSGTFPANIVGPSTVRVGGFNLSNNGNQMSNQFDGHLYDIQLYDVRLNASDALALYQDPGSQRDPDQAAPSPDPAAFEDAPTALSDTSVGVSAVVGTDAHAVEYYFAETSGQPGGDDSGWLANPSYIDTGLVNGLQYGYTVTTRDILGNVGATSPVSSVIVQTGSSASLSAVQSGFWADPATWGGSLPEFEDTVTIPMGVEVILNGDQECGDLTVMGRLVADPVGDCSLKCDSLMVMGMGSVLEVGTSAARYPHEFTLTLKGLASEAAGAMGTKFLGSMNGGMIEIHGPERVSWTRLGATAHAGTNTITVTEAVDWVAGEEIVITSTDTNWNHAEQKTIASVSPDGFTLTLTSNLDHRHTGVTETHTRPTDGKTWSIDLRAEVGLLSRDVKIQGDAFSELDGFGGHIMAMNGGGKNIEGAELYRMGQKGILGRYPAHWNLLTDQAKGQYVRNSSIHRSFNRAVTIHGTDYITVEDNFCYDHIGHGIFLENGAERFNTIRKNVVLLTKRPAPGEELTPSDNEFNEVQNRTPASYWITNPNNIFEDNVAAGTEGTGYWFIFPSVPLEPSRSLAYYAGARPSREPLGRFDRNTAHSCAGGLDINDKLSSNHAILRNAAWDNDGPFLFNDCSWFSNDVAIYAGIGGRKENVVYYSNTFSDNQTAIFLATYQTVEESMLIADSGHGNLLGATAVMYAVYDGAGQMYNNHMVGWDGDNASLFENIGASIKHANHRFAGFTWDHLGIARNVQPDFSIPPVSSLGANDRGHPRMFAQVIYDMDGSVTSLAGAAIITNHPFMVVGNETLPANWANNLISPNRFVNMRMSYPGGIVDASVVRTKGGTPTEGFYSIYGFQGSHHQLPFIVNDTFLYSYYYETVPPGKRINFVMDDTETGDHVLIRIKEFGAFTGLNAPGSSYASLAALESASSTGHFVAPNGDLYIRPVSTKAFDNAFSVTWTSTENAPPVDTDLDGTEDFAEVLAGTDPFGFQSFESDNFEFAIAGDPLGWVADSMISGLEVIGGRLQGQITGETPHLTNADFNFSGNSSVEVRIRYRSDTNGDVGLSWGTTVADSLSEARRVTSSYSGNGDWQELVFDLSRETEWLDHAISRIRIEPNGSAGNFEMDYIRGTGPTPPINDAYQQWQANNGVALDTADDDVDGVANLMEYAMGGLPKNPADGSALSPSLHAAAGGGFEFRFNKAVAGVYYSVEMSTDLVSWTPVRTFIPSDLSVGMKTIQLLGREKMFLRLRVTR